MRDQVQITPQRNTAWPASTGRWCWSSSALLALGLVMVYSASIALPDNPKFARYSPTYFLTRQALFIGIGFVVALIALQVPMAVWEKLGALALRRLAGCCWCWC